MNAPTWQPEFDNFSALKALADNDQELLYREADANPLAGQIEKARACDRFWGRDGSEHPYSPQAYGDPRIQAAVERCRELPTIPCGVVDSFWFSNCGRRIQTDSGDKRPGVPIGYEDKLKAITIEQAVAEHGPQAELELKQREYDYDLAAEVAEYGGAPIATVILHSPRGLGNLEFLVSQGWSRARVVRRVTARLWVPDCLFCSYRSTAGRISDFILVDCGGVLRVLPVCDRCEPGLARGYDALSHDWHRAWDSWDQAVGWPDDRFR